jgi:myo-inositol-1(or 4)-monophosphatase
MNSLDVAILAAQEAGRALIEHYNRPHDIVVKGLRDITTEADLQAEALAMEVVHRHFPTHRIVSEEASHSQATQDDGAPTWYIDPLDGTTNYARGYPMFSVSVAMAQRGQVQCGAVYHPLLGQLFTAARERGAYLNGQRLAVSGREQLIDALVLLDWPREPAMRTRSARFLSKLAPLTDAVRSGGSAALSLCYIAAGWADIYFQYTLSPWDVAAGMLIAAEAGATVTDLSGAPATLFQADWLVTNGRVHQDVLALNPWD